MGAQQSGAAPAQQRVAVLPAGLAALYRRPPRARNPAPKFWGLSADDTASQQQQTRSVCPAAAVLSAVLRDGDQEGQVYLKVVVQTSTEGIAALWISEPRVEEHVLQGGRAELSTPQFPKRLGCSAVARVSVTCCDQEMAVTYGLSEAGELVSRTRLRIAETEHTLDPLYGMADQDECIVCLSNPKTTACMPCGHFTMCESCGDSVVRLGSNGGQCPVCRAAVHRLLTLTELP
eukprot:TRINITY_DN28668_c0_g1_i2.p1 TRINITY_DN28668_c0_g1~~TRINITY_DN28668_c0_g1_i2.p1  ORF type:complete len:251 (+),score=73.04 TRINITY_DN28668_c0_g1_i2:57-755(+)